MQQRILGRTGRDVSAIGLGTWQLGADWGDVSEEEAHALLAASVDAGVTLFDTADVYGDGRSEQLIGAFLAEPPRCRRLRRDEDGPPRGAAARELHARELPRVDRPLARQPRRRHPRPRAAALPAERGHRGRRHLRRARRAGGRRVDRRLRRLGRDLRPGARRHRAAGRREHPDHPEPVPAEAARRGAAGRGGGRGRHPRPRAARLGAALRPLHRRDDVRRGRPPQLQPPRRGLRPRRDVLGRRLRRRASRPRASSRRRCPRASRCPPRRSPGWRRAPE